MGGDFAIPPPQPQLPGYATGHEGKMNLPPISISWLRHCGEFKSLQKLPF